MAGISHIQTEDKSRPALLVGMIPLEQKQSAFFSKLPPELRVQIASFLLCSKNDEGFVALTLDPSLFPSKSALTLRGHAGSPPWHLRPRARPGPGVTFAWLKTCRKAYLEGISVLYAVNTFRILFVQHHDIFTSWVSRFNGNPLSLASIRYLELYLPIQVWDTDDRDSRLARFTKTRLPESLSNYPNLRQLVLYTDSGNAPIVSPDRILSRIDNLIVSPGATGPLLRPTKCRLTLAIYRNTFHWMLMASLGHVELDIVTTDDIFYRYRQDLARTCPRSYPGRIWRNLATRSLVYVPGDGKPLGKNWGSRNAPPVPAPQDPGYWIVPVEDHTVANFLLTPHCNFRAAQ